MNESISTYPFPLNLYRELCSKTGKTMPDEITEDQIKGLNVLVDSIPNKRYRIILLERYLYCRTYDEIAKEYDFTSSRAGQIVQTTLKKLVNSNLSEMLMGYDRYLAIATIESLGLSTRAERAFLRNGINTLEDILYLGQENIRNLRAIGKDTLDEIMEKTWFLWDEEGDEVKEGLTSRQKENIRIALKGKGFNSKAINEFIEFVENNDIKNRV